MSAAVMTPSTALGLFGDFLRKNQQSPTAPGDKGLSWSVVGGPVHAALSRRSSTPVQCTLTTVASPVASASALLDMAEQAAAAVHRKLDRSVSEPSPSAIAKAAPVNTSRYKTELCRPFEENGSCKYGDKCQFAHGGDELRNLARHPKYKTELCRTFHTIGFCPYGPRCHFIHNAEEARIKMPVAASQLGLRPKPLCLGSTAESPSPSSSLSQSPTTSDGSFFCAEHENLIAAVTAGNAFSFGPEIQPMKLAMPKSGASSPEASLSPRESPSPGSPKSRLPVFNQLSNNLLNLSLTEMLS